MTHSACSITRRCSVFGRISLAHLYGFLRQDAPFVIMLVHKVHGGARHFYTLCKRSLIAREGRNSPRRRTRG